MLKRAVDFIVSLVLNIALIPVYVLVSVWIMIDDFGSPFFIQQRIGKHGVPFGLLKFRSMRKNAESLGQLTVGMRDPRITRSGFFIRKYKLDELPQLINVLIGQMSLVGPRPEVERYTKLYTEEQRQVLQVKPGITDYASIEYVRENELLAASAHPEDTYIHEIMPAKLELNKKYIAEQSFGTDMKIIWRTIQAILS